MKRSIALLLLSVVLSACATPTLGRQDLLDFIKDGKTTRQETVLNLGEPTGVYEGERIMSFRLGNDSSGYFLVGKTAGFAGVNTSLIMVFDENGVLKQHKLVPIKEP